MLGEVRTKNIPIPDLLGNVQRNDNFTRIGAFRFYDGFLGST